VPTAKTEILNYFAVRPEQEPRELGEPVDVLREHLRVQRRRVRHLRDSGGQRVRRDWHGLAEIQI